MEPIKNVLIASLQDPKLIIAILALILSYINLRRQQRKALSYDILYNYPIISLQKGIRERVKILFDERPVERVNLVVAKVANMGNVPISLNDFEAPLSFIFPNDAEILTAEITEKVPNGLPATLNVEHQKATINPVMMNAGDSLTIKMLVSRLDISPILEGRIIGVKEIKKELAVFETKNKVQAAIIAALVTLISTISVLTILSFIFKGIPKPIPDGAALAMFAMTGVVAMIAFTNKSVRLFMSRLHLL